MFDCIKREIRPSADQAGYLSKCFGHTRWYWNYLVDCGKSKVRAKSYADLKQEGFDWLSEIPAQALANTKLHYQQAWKNAGAHAAPPTFHSKRGRQSFTVCCQGESWLQGNRVFVPKLKSGMRIMGEAMPNKGVLKSAAYSLEPDGKYYASLLFDCANPEPLPHTDKKIGLDVGIETFCTTSDGEKIKLPNLNAKEQKVIREQKRLSRKAKGGKNRRKQKIKLARAHKAVGNTRRDFQHKLSKKITDESQVIAVEGLATKNMLKSHRLARAIARQGWRQFADMLRYKAERKSRTLVKIDRWHPSSRICSACGSRGTKKPLNVREWQCAECGSIHDRDINAAINILTAGTAGIAC
ncbi:MAG: transposase [Clostridiales bacterium]|nr:transposase [Clostridiales bacterium]